jgi:hypothetical protein
MASYVQALTSLTCDSLWKLLISPAAFAVALGSPAVGPLLLALKVSVPAVLLLCSTAPESDLVPLRGTGLPMLASRDPIPFL